LDLKKSSFKKLSKFLSKMQLDGLITVAEQKKGVEVITAINFEHPKLATFKVIKFEEAAAAPSDAEAPYEPPVITELRIVTAEVAKLFRACGHAKGDGLTLSQVKACLHKKLC
jgi:hypothetical protein